MKLKLQKSHPLLSKFYLVTILITLFGISFTHSACHTSHYTPDDCGLIEEIPGDTRTQIPWTAGIYLKTGGGGGFTLHATGTILSPTTILTVFASPIDKLSKKIKPGRNSGPENFLIGVGLRAGNLSGGNAADKHSQFAEVSFIEPHIHQESYQKDFHFVMFHLKTTLDFSTPFVKSICLPHFQLGRNPAGKGEFLHGGFLKLKQGANKGEDDAGLQVHFVQTVMGYNCVKSYEKYYGGGVFPVGMFCAVMPPPPVPNSGISPPTGCLMQGSAVTTKIGHQYYLAGLTTYIRGRKGGLCRNDTVYFNSRLSTANEWIEKSLRCSPFSFSCSDGTCIPLESVCNSVRNCLEDTDSDEHDVLCDINRSCGGDPSLHQCNLGGRGGCISKQQICDGVRDCDQGSDESPILCNREIIAGSRSSRHISKDNSILRQQHCPPIQESDGVQIEYVTLNRNALANCTFIPEGTFALSKCKPFHKSTQIQSRLERQCNEDGKWSDSNVKMQCEPDCGIANEKITFSGTNATKSDDAITLPWHTLLFNLDRSTQKIKFACAATIISDKYLITAGHCFQPNESLKSFKVVGAAVGKNFSENLNHDRPFITDIDNVWRPDEFDRRSRSADIALVKVKRPFPFGALIRPACFLDNTDKSINNKIATLPANHDEPSTVVSFAQTGLHIHDFPSVAEMACVSNTFGVTTALLQCVGHKQGIV